MLLAGATALAAALGLWLAPILSASLAAWNSVRATWPAHFQLVQIRSSLDGARQPAYFLNADRLGQGTAASTHRPLLVSLHSWSATYRQSDPWAVVAESLGWHYIRPDFRGANDHPQACLSPQVLADIDDAIAYALRRAMVDRAQVHIVGVSGGGYAALGVYLRTRHPLRSVQAWVPITSLPDWYNETSMAGLGYARDILRCTGSKGSLSQAQAVQRSPLSWVAPARPETRLNILLGIHDGHEGAVPISHGLKFFNALAEASGLPQQQVPPPVMQALIGRYPIVLKQAQGDLGGRRVLYERQAGPLQLTVFDGGHEMLPKASEALLRAQAGAPRVSGAAASAP